MQQSLSQGSVHFTIKNEDLLLLCEKAIFWPKKNALLLADLHIGKVTHFRKNNIPIPQKAAEKNFEILESLVVRHQPKVVYFLGDLFHSFYNREWEKLSFLLAKYPKVRFELITGNHDILHEEHYISAGIHCYIEKVVGPFKLTHHPEEEKGIYNLCGHIHPGVRMRGPARQNIKLPCFYFGANQAILPAFGSFTGTAALKIQDEDQVFAIFNEQIMKVGG